MKVRQLQDNDLENILSLWNRTMRYDQLSPELLEEKVWEDKDYSPHLAYVVEHENQIIGFIMGVMRQSTPEPTGYIKMLVIAAKYQRKGIGGRLLRELEKLLYNSGAKTIRLFESAPNYLTPGLDVRYTRGMVFFEKNGYKRFGETQNMEVNLYNENFDTKEREKILAGNGIDFCRATKNDADSVSALLQAHWPAWLEEVRNSFSNKPVSLHLAFYQGKTIGFSAYDCNNIGAGSFGPMATIPEYRRKGVGGILLQRCLRDLQAQGRRYAIIPWVGPIGFYVHYAGAEITRVFYRYQKPLNSANGMPFTKTPTE